MQIYAFKAWIFHLKFKVCLKFYGFFAFLQKAQNDKNSQIPKFPKNSVKNKNPTRQKTIPYYIYKNFSPKQPTLVTKVTAFHLLFSQICEILLIIGRKFVQISQIFAQFLQKCKIFTRAKPHFTTT